MKKILWIATLTAVLGLTAFTSISKSRVAGSRKSKTGLPRRAALSPAGAQQAGFRFAPNRRPGTSKCS